MRGHMLRAGGGGVASSPMVLVFDTTKSTGLTVTLAMAAISGTTLACTVDWGDGLSNTYTSSATSGTYSHAYAVAGTYTVCISGRVPLLGQPNGAATANILKLIAVESFGNVGLKAIIAYFRGANNLVSVPAELPASVTNLLGAFYYCASINDPNISSWDTSNVVNMRTMFTSASAFNQPLGTWNTSKVTDMAHMFQYVPNFNQNISTWDTSSVVKGMTQSTGGMDNMFNSATVFNQDLTGWCVSKIPSQPTSFAPGSALATSNYPVWGTCPAPT